MAEVAIEKRQLRRRRRIRAFVALGILGSALLVFHRPLLLGNVGTVVPEKVYRSAQPKKNLQKLIETYKPASILNLRGGSIGDDWYRAEIEAAEAEGIEFYDFPMDATRQPSTEELATLVELFEECSYPVLIHCKSGSDRTGLASGIYLMTQEGLPPEEALRSFSILYGHIPIGGPEHLHEPFKAYQDWLSARGIAHAPDQFRLWLLEQGATEVKPLEPGPRYGEPVHRMTERSHKTTR